MKKNLFVFIALIMALVGLQAQTTITNLPYVENFDGVTGNTSTTGLTNHVLPTGWEWYNNVASTATYANYPSCYNSSAYVHSTPNALRFHSQNTTAGLTTYSDQYAILPMIDVTAHPINTLQLDFNLRRYSNTSSYYVFLVVGVMSSPTDVSTFVPVDTIETTSVNYESFTVFFNNYNGLGQYIALMAPQPDNSMTHYNSFLVDDLVLDVIPTCPKPTYLSAISNSATQNSLALSWVENGSAMEWEIEYGMPGFAEGTGTKVIATSNPYTVTGLSASSFYDFRVRSVCSMGDTSQYSNTVTAQTQCGTITSLPYFQNFDAVSGLTSVTSTSSNLFQICWKSIVTNYTMTNTSYKGYPIVYSNSTYSKSKPNALHFYSGTGHGNEYGVLPSIDETIYPMNTLQVEFSAARQGTYAFNFDVGVMTDSSDASTFVTVASISIPTTMPTQTYNTYVVDFSNYTGTGRFIAFRMMKLLSGSSYLQGNIDDITVSTIPTCQRPMYVAVEEVVHNTATVSWQPMGDEAAWDVAVMPHGVAADANVATTVFDTVFSLTGLTPSTEYDVYVRANCGTEVSAWSIVETFTTRCIPVDTFPYMENFDSYTATTAVAAGVIPDCWLRYTNYTSPYPYIYSSQHASGTGSLYFYATSMYYSLAATPLLDLSAYNAGELMLNFKGLKSASTAGYGRIQVGVMTDPADISTFTLLKDITTNDYDNLGVWRDFHVLLPDQYSTPVSIAFYVPTATGTTYSFVDDIVLDYANICLPAEEVNVKNITGTTAKIVWRNPLPESTQYTIEYTVTGQNNWSSPVQVSGTNYTLSGLEPSTSYDVRITPICNVGTPVPVVRTFSTLCLIPEHLQVGTGTNTSYYVPVYTAYKHSYSQQLYRANEDMQNTQMAIDALAFQYAGTGSSKRNVDIYMMETMATDMSAWIDITTAKKVFSGDVEFLPNMSEGGWVTITLDTVFNYNGLANLLVAIHNHDTSATNTVTSDKTFFCSSVSGMTRYLSNTGSSTYDPLDVSSLTAGTAYANRPNIRFIHCNTSTICAPPTLSVTDVVDEFATVEWIPGYHETSWELEYKAASSPTWINEGLVTSTSYTLTNLLPNTDYQVRVRSLCTDTSAWVTELFHTVCSPLATVPFSEGFENATGNGAGNFVPCWVTQTNYTSAYPYTSNSTSYVHSGTYGVYFYATTLYYTLAATPRFDNSVRMDSLQIRFWAKKSSASYFIEVGIMSNPYDYNSFELIGTLSPDTINTWQEMSLTTAGYTGNGHFVAFRMPNNASNIMYVDDIDITHISPCARVNDVFVDNITNSTVDVHWVPDGENVSWFYTYGEKGTVDLATAVFASTSDTMVTLTNLTGNTEYDVYVVSECFNGYLSDPLRISFQTACDQITSLPFFENFDGLGGTSKFPDCWSRLYMSTATTTPLTTSYPYTSSSYYTSAPYTMYFFSNLSSTATYCIATLPEFDSSLPLNTLQVNFDMRQSGANYYMLVGAMTDPNDPSTFVAVDSVYCSATNTFEHKAINLASYTGNGQYISFKGRGDGIYVDNIRVDYAPLCNDPTNFTISDVHSHDVMLTWHPGSNETSWEIRAVPAGTTLPESTPIIVQNDTFYHLTNLEFGHSYDIYLRAICSGGTGYSAYVIETVSTLCDSIKTLPYIVNFEAVEGATSGSVNNLPDCWNYLNIGGTSSSYVGYPIVYRGVSSAYNSVNALRFYVNSTGTYGEQYAILPPINADFLSINDLQLSFYVRKYSSNNPHLKAIVGVMTDPTNDSTFTPVDTLICTSLEYELHHINLRDYTGNGRYIAIYVPIDPALSYNGGYFDNIVLDEIPVCLSVSNLQVTQIGITDISVSWTPNGLESSWVVQYKPTTDSVWNEDFVSATSAQITGLLPNTSYNIRVLADCGDSYSEPSLPIVVTTDCDVMTTLPFSTNFDSEPSSISMTVTTNNLPSCWHHLSIGCTSDNYAGYPIIYSSQEDHPAYSGANAVFFYGYTSGPTTYGDQYAILPGLDVTTYPISSLQLKFFAKKYSPSYPFNLVVGVMSDLLDPTTFVPVDTVSLVYDAYQPFTVYFDSYTGSGNFIALMVKSPVASYNAGYVDDIELSVAPTCRPVNNVRSTSVTSSSITIEWDANGSETNWIVNYKLFSDTVWMTQNVSGTPQTTLANLLSHSPYQIRVQADCGNGDLSEFATPLLVMTECNPITTLPYTEDFEGVQGNTAGTQNNLPACWNHLSGTYSPYVGYPIVYSTGNSNNAHSGINSIRFYTNSGSTDYGEQYAILPQIDVSTYPIHTLQLSFWARQSSNSTSNDFVITVGVMDNPLDPTSFALIQTVSPTDVNYSNFTVDFSNYMGTGSYIALKVSPSSTGSISNTGYVDDIEVSIAPVPCSAPTNVTASSIAPTSATISWTPGDAETSWNLQYKAASGNWSNSILVTNNPTYALTGLTDNTQYDVRVQAVCNAVTTSNWSDTAHFTTLLIVVAPTVTTNDATNVGQTTATLNGAITPGNETITAQGFEWKATSGGTYTAVNATGTTLSYDLTGLATSTSYTFRAFATTASGTTYGTEKTFTTQQGSVVAPTVTTNDATNVTETTATLHGSVAPGNETITARGFEWKETSASAYTVVNVTGATMSHDLTGLMAGTSYTFRAFATTASGTTYGAEKTFTTNQEQQETCPAPTNVNQVILLKTPNAIISWTQEEGDANEWKFFYKKVSESMWDSVITTTPGVQLTVEDSVLYEGYVVTHCTNGLWSNPSDTITFQGDHSGIDEYELNNVVVYPNPTSGVVQIKNEEWRMENVEVYDAYGKLLNTMSVNDHTVTLDLSGYAKGTYFVRVTTERGVVTKRVVKQ
jgi:hypothetical protein